MMHKVRQPDPMKGISDQVQSRNFPGHRFNLGDSGAMPNRILRQRTRPAPN